MPNKLTFPTTNILKFKFLKKAATNINTPLTTLTKFLEGISISPQYISQQPNIPNLRAIYIQKINKNFSDNNLTLENIHKASNAHPLSLTSDDLDLFMQSLDEIDENDTLEQVSSKLEIKLANILEKNKVDLESLGEDINFIGDLKKFYVDVKNTLNELILNILKSNRTQVPEFLGEVRNLIRQTSLDYNNSDNLSSTQRKTLEKSVNQQVDIILPKYQRVNNNTLEDIADNFIELKYEKQILKNIFNTYGNQFDIDLVEHLYQLNSYTAYVICKLMPNQENFEEYEIVDVQKFNQEKINRLLKKHVEIFST